jgi:hypothetical protein
MNAVTRQHWTNTFCLALLVGGILVEWAIRSLYRADYTWDGMLMAISWALGGVVIVVGLGSLILGASLAQKTSRILILLAMLYLLQGYARTVLLPPITLTPVAKQVIAGTAFIVAVLGAWSITDPVWARLRAAGVFGVFLFMLSPLLLVPVRAKSIDIQLDGRANGETHQVIYLLLDEMSAPGQALTVERLRSLSAQVHSQSVPSVGTDTIHVVPAMMGGAVIKDARMCTPSAICGAEAVFDFSRVRWVSSRPVHLLGFYHPYCATQGWSSCDRVPHPGPSASSGLLCGFSQLLPFLSLQCDWVKSLQWPQFQRLMTNRMMQSPFWTDGGVLFAHLPLPHPPGADEHSPLFQDYQGNLRLAADTVEVVWRRARERFGDEFSLVITSDHSLREKLWCSVARYRKNGCSVPAAYQAGTVPFIVASPKPLGETNAMDNAHFFGVE